MLNVLLFLGSYVGGFLFAMIRNPVWAFMLYQVVYFMNPMERWWSYMIPALSYSLFTVVLMMVVFIKDYKNHKLNRLFAAPQFKWVFLILFLFITTIPHAALPEVNKEVVINLLKLVVIISIAYKLIDENWKLDGVLAAFIAGAAYIGFLTYQVGRNMGDRVEGVGTVDSPDSNGIAAAIAPAIVLCLYYFWVSKRKLVKLATAVAGAFIANGIVLINSRGAFLATATSIMFFLTVLFFSEYQRKNQKASVIGVMFLGLIAAAVLVDETAIDRFRTIKSEQMTAEEETGATRMYFWLAAMDMAKDYPFGTGARGFEVHSPQYIPAGVQTGASRNRSVHSTWFESLTETGYLGMFCLIMMVWSSFRATKRCKKVLSESGHIDEYFKIVAIESAFIAYIVAMSFMNRYKAEILYWCVLFTACAYNIYIVRGRLPAQPEVAN